MSGSDQADGKRGTTREVLAPVVPLPTPWAAEAAARTARGSGIVPHCARLADCGKRVLAQAAQNVQIQGSAAHLRWVPAEARGSSRSW